MSSIVGDIQTAIKAACASTLTGSVELRRVYEPDQNDSRHPNIAYGVRSLSASPVDSVTRVYALDHGFEILLCKRFVNRDNDSDKQTVVNALYSSAHDLFKAMVNTKLGLSTSVLNVEQLSFSEPEILPNETALIRAQIVVKYRQTLT